MKKKYQNRTRYEYSWLRKLFKIMRLTFFLLVVSAMFVSAGVYSQNTKLNLEYRDVSIGQLLEVIEKQTDFRFAYSQSSLDPMDKVTINVKDVNLDQILKTILDNDQLTYKIIDRYVVISDKNQAEEINSLRQQSRVTGTVTNSLGEPIPGVTIVIKGTTQGIITDFDGNFSLSSIPENATLVFSFVGMKTQEIVVGNQSVINLVLEEETIGLDEVVAIGYGTQKREVVTGAITTVQAEDVKMSPAGNVTSGLAGRLSGVVINSRGGQPGRSTTEIFIRGKSTTEDTSPLYVVDGVVRDYNGLDRLDPNEIESITVLKDASAAIYGSRAANGVILVTTKRGKIGKPTVSFSHNQGFSQPTRIEEVASSNLFARMVNLSRTALGQDPVYSAEQLQKFADGSDPVNYPNTSWYDLVYRNWKNQSKTNISVSGGTENVRYFLSGGYLNQDSPYNKGFSYNKQYNVRANIDADISKNLTISFDLAGRLDDIMSAQIDEPHVNLGFPYQVPLHPNGLYGEGRTGDNALIMTREKDYGYLSTDGGVFTGNLSLKYKIPWIDGLSVSGTYAYDYNKQYEKDYFGVTYYYKFNQNTGEYDQYRNSKSSTPRLNIEFNQGVSQTANIRMAYVKSFNEKHNIDAFVGYEQNTGYANMLSAGRQAFLTGSIQELFAGTSNTAYHSNNSLTGEIARQNYFGRALYNYMNKYMVQFQFRYDGSQNFPANNRFGFFPGVSAGWTLSEEPFIQNLEFMDFLKIRGSWGQMGNDKVDAYQYMTAYTYGSNYVLNGVTAQGLEQSGTPNPNITWEIAKTTNVGLESKLFDGLFGLEFDYFNTKRSNILAKRNASVPDYSGLVLPDENIGEVKNQGVEFSISHNKYVNNNLRYSIAGNFTYVKNKVVYMDEAPQPEPYQKIEGKPIGAELLYEIIGVFDDLDDVNSYPHLPGTVPGDIIRKDANEDGVIDSKDQVRQSLTSTPEIVFGLNSKIEYKRFELSFMFQGQARARVALLNLLPYDPAGWGNFNVWLAEDGWSPENPSGTKPRPGLNFYNGYNGTDFRVFNGSFIRLKNAELAYNLPGPWLRKAGIEGCRVYITGYNLFSIDHAKKLSVDPEQTTVVGGGNPPERIINLGFNLTF